LLLPAVLLASLATIAGILTLQRKLQPSRKLARRLVHPAALTEFAKVMA